MWKKIIAGLLLVAGGILIFSNQINERYIDHQVRQTVEEALDVTPTQIRANTEMTLPGRLESDRFDFSQVESINVNESWQSLLEKIVQSESDLPDPVTTAAGSGTGQTDTATAGPDTGQMESTTASSTGSGASSPTQTQTQTQTASGPVEAPATQPGQQPSAAPTEPAAMTDEEARTEIKKYSEKYIIGIMKIPAIDLEIGILKGVLNRTLYLGAGTMRPDQIMGEGNYPLAGHRTTRPGLLFSGVPRLQNGQLIYITDKETIYTYRVYDKYNVHSSEAYVIYDQIAQERGRPVTTLVTCFSLKDPEIRVIVHGELIDSQPFTEEAFGAIR